MPFVAFTILVIGLFVIAAVLGRVRGDKKLRGRISGLYGKTPALGENGLPESLENIESIARYAEYMDDPESPSEVKHWRLDATTWNDLDMDKVFGRINVCQSSVGEEYLYNCLHELQRDAAFMLRRERLVRFLDTHPEDRLAIQLALAKVGKENYNGFARLIFDADNRFIKYQWIYVMLSLLPFLATAILFVHIPVGFIVVFASFVTNIAVHHRVKNQLESDLPAIEYLNLALRCCKRLCAMKPAEDLPTFAELKRCFAYFKPVMNRLPASQNKGFLDFDFIIDYIRILFLMDVRNFNRLIQAINRHNEAFHGIYRGIGEVETALCVANLRLTLPVYCKPEFESENKIVFTDLIHPLLKTPVANSGGLTGNSLLTGSNASGKSTFVKSLALGGVMAQTLYTVPAARFVCRFSWITTSMVMRDDIYGGDSYFIVEMKSLRRILDRVREHPCTIFIDEILRGTNTIERIAASYAVLEWLNGQNCLCVTASHDIELTHLLAASYDNYHFREKVTTDGVLFDYKLKTGPSTTRNAIKLLSVMDFGAEIVAQAEETARGYDENQKWRDIHGS
jgi:hypothetical protein